MPVPPAGAGLRHGVSTLVRPAHRSSDAIEAIGAAESLRLCGGYLRPPDDHPRPSHGHKSQLGTQQIAHLITVLPLRAYRGVVDCSRDLTPFEHGARGMGGRSRESDGLHWPRRDGGKASQRRNR